MTDDARPAQLGANAPAPPSLSSAVTQPRLRELSPTMMWLTAVGIVVLTAGAVVVLWWPATRGLNGAELVFGRLNALKVGLSVAVGSGGVVALYLSWRRQHSAERTLAHQEHDSAERRLTELYLKAVEQLGSPQAAVRHGGLYALERVAQDNPRQQQTVVNVICAYLRNPYTPPPETGGPRPQGVRRPLLKTTARPRTPAAPTNSGARETQQQEREVRLTAQRILYQHLQPGQNPDHQRPEFWRDIDIDLTGATLIDFSLVNCRIITASFRNATFTGRAGFGGAVFGGEVSFHGAKFGGFVNFVEAEFGSETLFFEAKFGEARFDRAKFGGDAWFPQVEFGGDARFDRVKFGGDAWFSRAKFGGGAKFDEVGFGGYVNFVEVEFGGNTGFAGVEFHGDTSFGGAVFGGRASFSMAVFGGEAIFGGAEFGNASFFGAKFGGNTSFDGTEFGGDAWFKEAVYDGRVFDPTEHGVTRRADHPDPAGGPDPM
ncbi:pentapeptide repeat-containing protein [Amycolatopsis mediterranei]|uniref:pentapeptide repeat-containing protein n=1 Tax=Amycolatopsis mediterranei TaxID=33910 RepID=UPI003433798F